jgi:hypothetical protein
VIGFVWLKISGGPSAMDTDRDTLDFEAPKG